MLYTLFKGFSVLLLSLFVTLGLLSEGPLGYTKSISGVWSMFCWFCLLIVLIYCIGASF